MPVKIETLVMEAEKARKKDYEDDEKEEFIEMGEEIFKLLKITPVFNSNMGFIKPFIFQL